MLAKPRSYTLIGIVQVSWRRPSSSGLYFSPAQGTGLPGQWCLHLPPCSSGLALSTGS